jgi:hypothetical protein
MFLHGIGRLRRVTLPLPAPRRAATTGAALDAGGQEFDHHQQFVQLRLRSAQSRPCVLPVRRPTYGGVNSDCHEYLSAGKSDESRIGAA